MQAILDDLIAAARGLVRRPGYSILAMLILALGIGATTAIWSVLDPVLLRAESFDRDRDLASLWKRLENAPDLRLYSHSTEGFDAYRAASTLSGVARYQRDTVALFDGRTPQRVDSAQIDHLVLPLLRAAPLLGRNFVSEDLGRHLVLIHEALWRDRFGARDDVLGQQIEIDGESHEIVGVVGAELTFPRATTRVWTPLLEPADGWSDLATAVIGRVAKDVSIDAAEEELTALLGSSGSEHVSAVHSVRLHMRTSDRFDDRTKASLWLLFGAVGVLLLTACANAANLGLTHSMSRRGEFSIRHSLGASRRRLVRLLVIESAVLSLVGGALGLVVARLSLPLLIRLAPDSVRQQATKLASLDGRVVLFATIVAVLAATIVGLFPALRSTVGVSSNQRTTASISTRRAGTLLATFQVALAFVLLFATGLLLRSFDGLVNTDPGFELSNVLAIDLTPGASQRQENGSAALYERLERRIEALPFVRNVSTGRNLAPNAGVVFGAKFQVEGGAPLDPNAPPLQFSQTAMAPDTFDLLQLPLIAGTTFRAAETNQIILGVSAVKWLWGDRAPRSVIGERVRMSPQQPWQTVVGVAAKVQQSGPLEAFGDDMETYSFIDASAFPNRTLLIQTDDDPLAHLADLRAAIWQVDERLPLHRIRTLEGEWARTMDKPRFLLEIIGGLATLTLLLTIAGMYSVLARAVQNRRREIGVRMALGAQARSVVWLVARQGLLAATFGTLGGLLLSRLGSTWLASQLFSVSTLDGGVMSATVGFTVLIVLLAACIPTVRALRVQPAETMRADS